MAATGARCGGVRAVAVALLATSAASCASMRTVTDAALGRTGRETLELQKLQRAERAQALTTDQIDRRLAFLMQEMDDTKLHAAAWQYGWIFIDSAGALASAGQAAFGDEDKLAYHTMRAVKGAIGTAYLVLNPQPLRCGAEPIRRMPSETHSDKMDQLLAAENLMVEAAERAHQRTSWAYHIGNLLFNAAGAGAVYATGDESGALQALLIDTAAGELQVWTQPWEPPSQWEAYERMIAEDEGRAAAYVPGTRWRVITQGAGFAVQASF